MTQSSYVLQLESSPADIVEATESLYMTLSYAELAFGFLARMHGSRDYDGHLGFEAVCTLCQRALASVGDNEGLVVEKLVASLRRAQPAGMTQ